jgi:hypothetical protein
MISPILITGGDEMVAVLIFGVMVLLGLLAPHFGVNTRRELDSPHDWR